MPHKHKWVEVERLGNVVKYKCAICPKTKVRIKEGK
jgi:hypothetical protein